MFTPCSGGNRLFGSFTIKQGGQTLQFFLKPGVGNSRAAAVGPPINYEKARAKFRGGNAYFNF